jgi:copper ion binding protein
MNKKTIIKVTGMSCSGCASRVEKALKSVAGVSGADIDLKAGKATVEYDPLKAAEKDLVKAVRDAGYGVG